MIITIQETQGRLALLYLAQLDHEEKIQKLEAKNEYEALKRGLKLDDEQLDHLLNNEDIIRKAHEYFSEAMTLLNKLN